jgi:hypothetical protein
LILFPLKFLKAMYCHFVDQPLSSIPKIASSCRVSALFVRL